MVSKQKCNGKTKRRTTDQSEILIGKITSQTVHINHNYGSWLPLRDWWIEQLYISRTFSQLGRTFSISNCFWAMVLSKGQPCSYVPMMCVSVLVSKHIFAKHAEMPATNLLAQWTSPAKAELQGVGQRLWSKLLFRSQSWIQQCSEKRFMHLSECSEKKRVCTANLCMDI